MIPGIAFKDILGQVLDAYKTLASLAREVEFRLEVPIANVVNVHAPLEDLVFDLIKWADGQGRVGELVRELAAARPQHSGMQAVARKYATLLTPSTDPAEYARFFDNKPAISLQTSGVKDAVVPVADAGFEITRKKALGFFDATFFADMLSRMSRRICRVELNDPDNSMGTAFLVGPQTLLTNYHVIEKVIDGARKGDAPAVKFRFDYFKATPKGLPSDGVLVGLDRAADLTQPWLLGYGKYSSGERKNTPDNPPPTPGELDYALLRLDQPIGNEANSTPRGWIDMPTSQPAMAGAPLLMILQHPERDPIKLAFDSDPGAEIIFNGLRVRYQVNTERGSSGSPVFDKDWRLVALHHYGDPSWQAAYNQGVPIGLIRDHLSPAARTELGKRIESLPQLEVAAAAAVALEKKFGQGTAGVSRADIEGIFRTAAAAIVDPLAYTQAMSDTVRETIGRKIKQAEDEWQLAFEGSDDPVIWQKAADRKKKLICNALKQGKQLNGGELPDDWLKWWVDLGCSN